MMLLRLSPEGVKKLLDGYEKYVEDIKSSAVSMAWYMRGGISYGDILNMSVPERESVRKLIDENLETTKKTQMPFF
jgi:hypothetical protein